MIAVNPKEYIKKYRHKSFNKKHKGLKNDTPGMHIEAYAHRVTSLNGFTNQKVKKIQQNRFQIKKISKEECRVYPKVNLPDYMIKDSMFKTVLFLCLLVILCLKLRKAKKKKNQIFIYT